MAMPTAAANGAFAYALAGSLTAYTPPSNCTSYIIDDLHPFSLRYPGNELSTACFPTKMSLFNIGLTAAYYSPARCPGLYTPFSLTDPVPGATKVVGDDPAATGEYIYNCCPSGLWPNVIDSGGRGCISYITAPTEVTYRTYTSHTLGTTDLSTSFAVGLPYTVRAYYIQVRFQNSDLADLKLSDKESTAYGLHLKQAAATKAGSISSVSATSSTTVTHTSSASSGLAPGASSGLAPGAKIAIGVSIPLTLILLAAITVIWFILKKQRKEIRELKQAQEVERQSYRRKPELPVDSYQTRTELPGDTPRKSFFGSTPLPEVPIPPPAIVSEPQKSIQTDLPPS